FQSARKTLNFVGYEGIAMIAIAGIDMAIWDALAKAAQMPLAVLLGGSLAPVPAYNSNGLWLSEVHTLTREAADLAAEGGFEALRTGAGDYFMPDLMRIGGVSGWLRSSPIAAAAGIQMSTHLYPEFSAHLMRVTETAHWLEWQDWANPILARPYAVKDGYIHI